MCSPYSILNGLWLSYWLKKDLPEDYDVSAKDHWCVSWWRMYSFPEPFKTVSASRLIQFHSYRFLFIGTVHWRWASKVNFQTGNSELTSDQVALRCGSYAWSRWRSPWGRPRPLGRCSWTSCRKDEILRSWSLWRPSHLLSSSWHGPRNEYRSHLIRVSRGSSG